MSGYIRHKFCEEIKKFCTSIGLDVYLDEFHDASYIGEKAHGYDIFMCREEEGEIVIYGDPQIFNNIRNPKSLELVKTSFLGLKAKKKSND